MSHPVDDGETASHDWEVIPSALPRPLHDSSPRVRSVHQLSSLVAQPSIEPVRHFPVTPKARSLGSLQRPDTQRVNPVSLNRSREISALGRPKSLACTPKSLGTSFVNRGSQLNQSSFLSSEPPPAKKASAVKRRVQPNAPPRPSKGKDSRGGQPSQCRSVQHLWTQFISVFLPFSELLRNSQSSSNFVEHSMRILDAYTSTTVVRYLQCLLNLHRLVTQLRLDLSCISEVDLADLLQSLPKCHMAVKAIRWATKAFQLSCFAHAWGPLINSFLKIKTPHDRRETLPYPLVVIVQWERRILQSSTPPTEVITLGALLLMAWASLRFSDLQRSSPDSLAYDNKTLRGLSWRTKTFRVLHLEY